MKPLLHSKVPVAAGVGVVVLIAVALAVQITHVSSHYSDGPSEVEYMKVLRAAVAYRQDLEAQGAALPVSVSLKQLLDLQVLTKQDLVDFKDTQVNIAMMARPRLADALISVSMADGFQVSVLGDGSVQQSKR